MTTTPTAVATPPMTKSAVEAFANVFIESMSPWFAVGHCFIALQTWFKLARFFESAAPPRTATDSEGDDADAGDRRPRDELRRIASRHRDRLRADRLRTDRLRADGRDRVRVRIDAKFDRDGLRLTFAERGLRRRREETRGVDFDRVPTGIDRVIDADEHLVHEDAVVGHLHRRAGRRADHDREMREARKRRIEELFCVVARLDERRLRVHAELRVRRRLEVLRSVDEMAELDLALAERRQDRRLLNERLRAVEELDGLFAATGLRRDRAALSEITRGGDVARVLRDRDAVRRRGHEQRQDGPWPRRLPCALEPFPRHARRAYGTAGADA